jgi:hypothetical protein
VCSAKRHVRFTPDSDIDCVLFAQRPPGREFHSQGAFAESLRNFGAFDAMLPFMRRVPLHSRVGMSTTGLTATTVAQHHPKPITKLSMTATTLDEKKAVAIVVLTF